MKKLTSKHYIIGRERRRTLSNCLVVFKVKDKVSDELGSKRAVVTLNDFKKIKKICNLQGAPVVLGIEADEYAKLAYVNVQYSFNMYVKVTGLLSFFIVYIIPAGKSHIASIDENGNPTWVDNWLEADRKIHPEIDKCADIDEAIILQEERNRAVMQLTKDKGFLESEAEETDQIFHGVVWRDIDA